MKSMIFLLAAAFFILPAWGHAAEKKDIHAVMTAEEGHAPAAGNTQKDSDTQAGHAEESAIDEEMDDLGDESVGGKESDKKGASVRRTDTDMSAADAKEETPTAEGEAVSSGDAEQTAPVSTPSAEEKTAAEAAAYGAATAIDPVTLADGDWAFIEGDERRGWFFDRSRMRRNEDGSISYWQLILYNDLGRAQFVRAMHDEAYENLGYTLQRRVLNLKDNTIRTYEIIACDGDNAVIAESDRDGHAAEIRPNTMAEKERDVVKKAAKKLKSTK